jgi:hypothetical protein
MLAITRELMGKGRASLAALVTKEILRRTPNFAAAQRLLAEAELVAAQKK